MGGILSRPLSRTVEDTSLALASLIDRISRLFARTLQRFLSLALSPLLGAEAVRYRAQAHGQAHRLRHNRRHAAGAGAGGLHRASSRTTADGLKRTTSARTSTTQEQEKQIRVTLGQPAQAPPARPESETETAAERAKGPLRVFGNMAPRKRGDAQKEPRQVDVELHAVAEKMPLPTVSEEKREDGGEKVRATRKLQKQRGPEVSTKLDAGAQEVHKALAHEHPDPAKTVQLTRPMPIKRPSKAGASGAAAMTTSPGLTPPSLSTAVQAMRAAQAPAHPTTTVVHARRASAGEIAGAGAGAGAGPKVSYEVIATSADPDRIKMARTKSQKREQELTMAKQRKSQDGEARRAIQPRAAEMVPTLSRDADAHRAAHPGAHGQNDHMEHKSKTALSISRPSSLLKAPAARMRHSIDIARVVPAPAENNPAMVRRSNSSRAAQARKSLDGVSRGPDPALASVPQARMGRTLVSNSTIPLSLPISSSRGSMDVESSRVGGDSPASAAASGAPGGGEWCVEALANRAVCGRAKKERRGWKEEVDRMALRRVQGDAKRGKKVGAGMGGSNANAVLPVSA